MNNNDQLKKYAFVLYPVIVIFMILYSLSLWQNGTVSQINQLFEKKDKATEEEAKLAILKKKYNTLSGVNKQSVTEDLDWVLKAYPAVKQVALLMGEISKSASDSGVVLQKYGGSVGEVTEATQEAQPGTVAKNVEEPINLEVKYQVDNYDMLRSMVGSLEKSLPLLQISKMVYGKGTAEMTLVGAWTAWTPVAPEAMSEIPEYKVKMDKLRAALSDFNEMPEAPDLASDGGVINPF